MLKIFYSAFFFLVPSLSFAGTLQDFAANLAKDSKIKSLKIAVMDINTTETGGRQDAIIVRERITTFLLQNEVRLVERSLLEKVLQEQRLQASGAVGQDTVKQIGELTGADAILSGTLAEITDTSIELNARVIDVKSGEIVSAGQAVFKKDWKAPPAIPVKETDIAKDGARDYFNRGMQYYSEGKYSVSIEFFSKAIKADPAYLEAYYYRGSINLLKGNFEPAISDFSSALDIKPDFFEGYYNRGVAYSNIGDHEKALQDYTKAIELNPEFADAYHNRGVAFDNLKQFESALADYSKAIQLNPKSAMSYYYRAKIYDSPAKYDQEKALRDYDSFVKLNPNDAEGHFYRGLLYSVSGETDKAIQDYKKVLTISPRTMGWRTIISAQYTMKERRVFSVSSG